MAVHPVRCTFTADISGFSQTDTNKPARIDAGVYKPTVDNSKVDGNLIVAEKADTGSTPKKGTIEYQGVIRFDMPDTVTLANTDKNKGIKGAANGGIKLVAYSSTYDENLGGRVVNFSNTTGNKWIDVLMPAQ